MDLQALKLKVDTADLERAVGLIDKLQTATVQAEKTTQKVAKSQGRSESNRELDKQSALLTKLNQLHKDLADGYTRGESSVLRYARSIGISDGAMQQIIKSLTEIKKLTKDPFDSAIGSVRSIKREFEELRNRTDLAKEGINLSTKQLREYSKLSDEIAGKMSARKLDPFGKDQVEYTKALTEARKEYLEVAKQVNAARSQETTVIKGGKSNVADFNKVRIERGEDVRKYIEEGLTKGNARELAIMKQHGANVQQLATRQAQMMQAQATEQEKISDRKLSKIRSNIEQEIAMRRQEITALSQTGAGNPLETLALQNYKTGYASLGAADKQKVKELADTYRVLDSAQRQAGKSSKEMAFAMRQVPMQITDIVVSLSGGQSPLQVLLQQGGQLKDLFGGVKEAAVALAAGVKDALAAAFKMLISPVGLALTAIGSLGYAMYEAADRSQDFNKAIILMGNTTNLTLPALEKMASVISSSTGTSTRFSGESFLELAKGSKLSQKALEDLTITAINFEKYGGYSVKETAKNIASLQDDPLTAMLKLNKEIGFLTPELVKSASAFVEQGRSIDASKLLIDAYGKATQDMTSSLMKNLGNTEKMWIGIKGAIIGATDALIGMFAAGDSKQIPWYMKLYLGESSTQMLAGIRQQEENDKAAEADAKRKLASQADAQAQIRKLIQSNVDSYKTKAHQQELSSLITAAGPISDESLLKGISALKKSKFYTGESEKKGLSSEQQAIKAIEEQYKIVLRDGKEVNRDYAKQLELISKAKLSTEERAKAIEDLEQKQPYYKREEQHKKELKYAQDIQDDFQKQIDIQLLQIENQTKGLALTEEEKLVREQLLKLETEYLRKREDIKQRPGLSDSERQGQLDTLQKKLEEAKPKIQQSTKEMYEQSHSFAAGWDQAFKSYTDSAKNAAAFGQSAFSKMTDGMTDSILEFVKTGKMSFSNLADSIITEILRIQIRAAAAQIVGNSGLGGLIGNMFGGSNATTSTANSNGLTGAGDIGANMAAKGAYFGSSYANFSSGVQAFANGGTFTNSIVNSPTLFKFAKGSRFGLMGEAGPEAIMPLKRSSDGSLGVSAEGASSAVIINITNNGNPVQVDTQVESIDSRGNRRIDLTISEMVSKEQSRPGSAMYNSTKNTFGLRPALTGR